MKDLYTEKDLAALRARIGKRQLVLVCVSMVWLALAVVSRVLRVEWLTVVAVVQLGASLIFGLEMLCLPLKRYARLMEAALHGRSHTETFVYDHLEPESSLVDGVSCRSLVFLGEPDKHGTRETLFYWDAELPAPALEAGKEYTFRYTGKNIIALDA